MLSDYDYLEQMKPLAQTVGNQSDEPEQQVEVPELDPEHYKAYAKAPTDLDEETINHLVDLIDGKESITPKPEYITNESAPATIDRVLNSETIIYITEDDLPVGVVTIIDPSSKNYQGYVPLDLFAMFSATNLDGRLQQEFFAVADYAHGKGIGRELRAQIASLGIKTFTIIDANDTEALKGMVSNGYKYVCTMPLDASPSPVTIWVDNC